MRESKSKAPLVLMEQVIMVLVFSLAAALCVQAFALSGTISKKLVKRDHAMAVSQTMAETIKACGGNMARAQKELGGRIDGETLTLSYDADWNQVSDEKLAVYFAIFKQTKMEQLCGHGQVSVTERESQKELFSLEIVWQEELTDE